jgi:hypothetical protein
MFWFRARQKNKLYVSLTRSSRARVFRPELEVLESRQLLAVVALGAPLAIGPSGSVSSAEPTFTWSPVVGADHYDVWVDDQTSGQSAVLRNQDVVGVSWTPTTPLATGDSYSWGVRAIDSTNTVLSLWSSVLDFSVTVLPVPTSIGPNGSLSSAEPAFTWNAVTGADHYDVWVNDTTLKQSAVLRNQDVVGNSWMPTTPLKAGDTYTWWVRAVDNSGANFGGWSSPLVFSVATLGKPILAGPIGSTSGDTPTFTWSAVTGADHYDFWVSDLTSGQSSILRNQDVLGTSWSDATALTPGHNYRWWARAVDASNTNFGAWSAPVDFSVTPLGQPSLVGPSGSADSDTPAFTWDAVAGADHYDVWVNDLTSGTSGALRNQDVSGTSWTPSSPLNPGDSYRWWVRAVDSTSTVTGSWSSPLSFSIAPLAVPVLSNPAGTITAALPAFTWNTVAGADHYDIWINDVTSGKSAVLRNQDVPGTSWTPAATLTPGDNFRWWVRAVDSSGSAASAWSSPLNFTVTALAVPTPVNPSGSITSAEPVFAWNAATGADHYDVWVNDVTTGKTAVLRDQNVTGTTWTPSMPLTAGDKFRWWVRAVDSTSTNNGAWSSYVNFTVSALIAPILIGPKDSANSATPTFTWNAAAGADHYDVWINNVTTGQSMVLRDQNVAGTSWTATSALPAGDSYRWWVRAVDNSGDNVSAWSQPFVFSLAGNATQTV